MRSSNPILRQSAQEAGKALADQLTEDAHVKIGDLVINEETGEIVEWPEGAGDQLEGLVMRLRQAKDNEEGWKQAQGVLKAAIGRILTDRGVKSLSTQYGTVGWRGKTTTSLSLPELAADAVRREISRADLLEVLQVLGNVQVSREREEALANIDDAIPHLLVRSESAPYIQLDKPRAAPPAVERGRERSGSSV